MLTGPRKVSGRRVGEAAVMQTNTTYPSPTGADPEELDRQIAELDSGVANEAAEDLRFPTGRPLAEAPGCPPLCAHGMNSLTDRDYDLALGRLRRG
jgi:hypothetical protein